MMTTYNRPKYFKQTIESLQKTGDYTLGVFDDGSDDPEKLKLLYKYENEYFVHYSEENKGTVLNTIPNIDLMFRAYEDSKYIALIQDDIIFSKNWLSRGVEIFDKINEKCTNIAFLSLFNRKDHKDKEYYIMRCGHPGGVALLISRKFWTRYRKNYDIFDYGVTLLGNNDKSNSHKVRNLVDWKLGLRAVDSGFHMGCVGRSLVKHIGDVSSMPHGNCMKFVRLECEQNFVGEDK